MRVFTKHNGTIIHFWGTETIKGVAVLNLLDFTPEGRPDRDTPPQKFRSKFLEKNYLSNGVARPALATPATSQRRFVSGTLALGLMRRHSRIH
jgi:hypothetical protein